MPKLILKMEDSYQQLIDYPKYPHSAIICGQTGVGKSEYVLDLLEDEYKNVFDNIIILCPTIEWNKAYKNRKWIGDVKRGREASRDAKILFQKICRKTNLIHH